MPRKVTTGTVGKNVLGTLSVSDDVIKSLDTNANIHLDPDGTGEVQVLSNIQIRSDNEVRLYNSTNSAYIGLKAPSAPGSTALTLPTGQGTSGQLMQVGASGQLGFVTPFLPVTNDTAGGTPLYPLFSNQTSGNEENLYTSSTNISFLPSDQRLTVSRITVSNSLDVSSAANLGSNVDINGGAIDGTTIGASSASTGAFTTLTATSITETSSIAYKENVNPITDALDSILDLAGVTYDRKDGSAKNEAGLIAEDVAEVLPNLVTYKDGKPEGINYTKLSAYLIEAVKDLADQVKKLKE